MRSTHGSYRDSSPSVSIRCFTLHYRQDFTARFRTLLRLSVYWHHLYTALKKVNASHTRYRALGPVPELIPVYRQLARRWLSHPPGSRLSLLSIRPAVTFQAAEHHRPLDGTKLYCLVTETHRCEQLAQGCYAAFAPSRILTHDLLIASPTLYRCDTAPPLYIAL